MAFKDFIKQNFVLVMGLALPVLLMAFFMISVMIPASISDPPKYDMVFSSQDYGINNGQTAVSLNLVVKDGVLKAQYVKNPAPGYYGWKKLYIYEAKTQKVRELTLGLPVDIEKIEGMREETVDSTKDLKLDTTLEAPDGYQLSHDGYSRSGIFNDVFWGGGYNSEVRLRNKNGSSVKLLGSDNRTYFYYGNVQFIGWVKS